MFFFVLQTFASIVLGYGLILFSPIVVPMLVIFVFLVYNLISFVFLFFELRTAILLRRFIQHGTYLASPMRKRLTFMSRMLFALSAATLVAISTGLALSLASSPDVPPMFSR